MSDVDVPDVELDEPPDVPPLDPVVPLVAPVEDCDVVVPVEAVLEPVLPDAAFPETALPDAALPDVAPVPLDAVPPEVPKLTPAGFGAGVALLGEAPVDETKPPMVSG